MKKILFSLSLLIGLGASAQLPDGSLAPDFTLTDINGTSHNLYTYLNQGKTVFIDVSATWCGPCWAFHQTGALDDLWKNHGPAGAQGVNANTTNDVIVIFIEGDGTTTSAELHGGAGSQGDWVTGVDHPIIDPPANIINAFNNSYAIGYFPTVYKICPNRILTEVGTQSANALYNTVGTCSAPASAAVDAKFLSYKGSSSICGPASYTPKVEIQNNGLVNLTSATVTVKQNGTVISTGTYSGNLTTYSFATVTCSEITDFSGGMIDIQISTNNDANLTNNSSQVTILSSVETTNKILLTMTTDGYADEIGWKIKNAAGAAVAGTTNPALSDNTTYNQTYTLNDLGCYTFSLTDSYGDGLIGNGAVNLRDDMGQSLLTSVDYGDGIDIPFKVVYIVGAPELSSSVEAVNNEIQLCTGQTVQLTSSSPSGNLWSNGATTRSITVSDAGSYSVTAQNGTSTVITVVVNDIASPTTGTISESTCNGNNDGTIEILGTGTGDLMWNGNVEANVTLPFTLSNLAVGNYQVYMATGNCMSDTIVASIADAGAITPTISASGNTTFCIGEMVTLTSSEATGNVWSTGETTQSIDVSTTEVISLVNTDVSGCSATSLSVPTMLRDLPTVSAGTNVDVCVGSSYTFVGEGAMNYVWDNNVLNGDEMVINATGTYNVVGTDMYGCSNSASVTITALDLPTVNAGIDTTLCQNTSYRFVGTGAPGLFWSNGATNNVAMNMAVSLTYTLIGVGANGCSNTDQLVVTVLNAPNVNAGVDQTVCLGQSVTLNAVGAVSYTWNNGVSNNVAFSNPVGSVTYTVTGVGANNCTATDQVKVITQNCASIEETVNSVISIYPNPATDNVIIKSNTLNQFNSVELVDQLGRVISTYAISGLEMNIKFEGVANGNYLLVFKGDNSKTSQKIQINK